MTRSRASAVLSVLTVILILFGSCPPAEGETLQVFVSIPPQAYLVERLAGDKVEVHHLASEGQDPHTFEPTPRQVQHLTRANLYFTIGVPFESRVLAKIRSTQKDFHVVDSTAGIARRMMTGRHHSHNSPEKNHGSPLEGEPDPHVWLSPPLLKVMADNMHRALIAFDREHQELYEENFKALIMDLEALHRDIAARLAPYAGRTFYVFHPAFGYFADAYGLHQEAVERDGKAPTPRQLSAFIQRAKADNVKIIFAQPQFDQKSAAAVAEALGAEVVPLDSIARNVLNNLAHMAREIQKAMQGPSR